MRFGNRGLLLILSALMLLAGFSSAGAQCVVTNTNDSGAGSLRQCVADIAADQTITFDEGLTGDQIQLTSGEIFLNKNMTITGLPGQAIEVNAGDASRIFQVSTGASVTLESMVLDSGSSPAASGGAIYSQGDLTLSDVTISNCSAAVGGGAVAATGGALVMSGVDFLNNEALAGGGGGNGGAVHATANTGNPFAVGIDSCTFDSNIADQEGGALYLASQTGSVAIVGSLFSLNTASNSFGGALSLSGADNLAIADCTLDGNTAGGVGGAIYASEVNGDIRDVGVTGNSGSYGGGLFNTSALASPNSLTLVNASFQGNTATEKGGAVHNQGTLDMSFVSMVGNGAAIAGGVNSEAGTLRIKSCVAGGNLDVSGGETPDVSGAFTTSGGNVIGVSDGSTGFSAPGDAFGSLGAPLSTGLVNITLDLGGQKVAPLLAISPARGFSADDTEVSGTPVGFDQRGVSRPAVNCDSGAFQGFWSSTWPVFLLLILS